MKKVKLTVTSNSLPKGFARFALGGYKQGAEWGHRQRCQTAPPFVHKTLPVGNHVIWTHLTTSQTPCLFTKRYQFASNDIINTLFVHKTLPVSNPSLTPLLVCSLAALLCSGPGGSTIASASASACWLGVDGTSTAGRQAGVVWRGEPET